MFICVQEMLFSVREKLNEGEVVTGADVEEFEDVEQTTASWDHTQSVCGNFVRCVYANLCRQRTVYVIVHTCPRRSVDL